MIETTVDAIGVPSAGTVPPETPVSEAAQHLREPDVSALVVEDDGAVVGIVTESDIVALVAETDAQPTVRAIMSAPVRTTESTAALTEAAERMRSAGVKHLPVVDDGGYHGLLSARMLASYLPRYTLEIEWQDEPLSVDPVDSGELTASD